MIRILIKNYLKPLLINLGIYNYFYFIYSKIISKNQFLIKKINKKFLKTAPILLYHRISDIKKDPHMLSVKPETFDKHLNFIKNNFQPISLYELSERIKNKKINGKEIAITFDDGYKDNITNALPLLEKHNIPATIFVTTSHMGSISSFPWDLEYEIQERAFFLDKDEILKLSKHPLIEIGSHTHNHIRLSDFPYKKQLNDIKSNKNILEEITKNKIRLFAYPFGGRHDFNRTTIKIVQECDFEYAYINNNFLSNNKDKKYKISRINIRESDINTLKKNL